jgi:hypothetical protein
MRTCIANLVGQSCSNQITSNTGILCDGHDRPSYKPTECSGSGTLATHVPLPLIGISWHFSHPRTPPFSLLIVISSPHLDSLLISTGEILHGLIKAIDSFYLFSIRTINHFDIPLLHLHLYVNKAYKTMK